MGFRVKQECPQCGGPVELDEADHILQCPYCDVKSFLYSKGPFRFLLPPKNTHGEIIHVPYLRFRGVAYSCQIDKIGHRILDITQLGIPLKRFPISLGLRPQAMKMRFVTSKTDGAFFKCLLKTSDMLKRASKQAFRGISNAIFHEAFLGEATNMIYLPLYKEKGRLFDAITQRPLARLPSNPAKFEAITDPKPSWQLSFLATLCPKCGWNMEGEKDSVILICRNCQSAWAARREKFVPVDYAVNSGNSSTAVYLPFWKMTARLEGIGIDTYADFISVTRQPRTVKAAWKEQPMQFWTPAFKIRPKIFLRLCGRLTLGRPDSQDQKTFPDHLHPVTLPLSEAIQAIKVVLAGIAVNKKDIVPQIPKTRVSVQKASLVYLPFRRGSHELIEDQTEACINRKALEFGRYL